MVNTVYFMAKELISQRMLKEHGKMLKLLDDFTKGKKNSYEQLKELQEKHAYAEEKAIFIFYKDKKNLKVLSIILEQHEQLREYVKVMQEDNTAAKKFEILLKTHIKLEDTDFYPMLDKDLSPEDQKRILDNFTVLMG
jgi:hemerythrin-like domain-containing protein